MDLSAIQTCKNGTGSHFHSASQQSESVPILRLHEVFGPGVEALGQFRELGGFLGGDGAVFIFDEVLLMDDAP